MYLGGTNVIKIFLKSLVEKHKIQNGKKLLERRGINQPWEQ